MKKVILFSSLILSMIGCGDSVEMNKDIIRLTDSYLCSFGCNNGCDLKTLGIYESDDPCTAIIINKDDPEGFYNTEGVCIPSIDMENIIILQNIDENSDLSCFGYQQDNSIHLNCSKLKAGTSEVIADCGDSVFSK